MPPIDNGPLLLFGLAVGGYLLGSIPFGLVMARLFGLGDLRQIGSGNIGATNVLRTGSRAAAILTLIFDAGKGAIAVVVARALAGEEAGQLAGGTAFLGHLYPVWLGFQGGKGVATFLGTLLAAAWPLGLAACATWAVTAALFRISSLSALAAAVLAPLWAVALGHSQAAALALVLGALVTFRHKANISRLVAGTEPKIGAGK
ncbi:MAG: glycerol-3-phosphate 1-O-acyltransferase PlsY [Pseudomonadota bacterium]